MFTKQKKYCKLKEIAARTFYFLRRVGMWVSEILIMSGVLFVIYIPTKEVEERIRQSLGEIESIAEEDERTADTEKNEAPLSTPEMQRRESVSHLFCCFLGWHWPYS